MISEKIVQRSLVFCLAENSIGSLVGYLSFITKNIVPLMLDSSLNQDLLDRLIHTYKPKYIWVPEKNNYVFIGGIVQFNILGYSLIKLSQNKIYKLHEDLGILYLLLEAQEAPS